MPDLWENPIGTDGFEFVEYAAPDPRALGALFERMGFKAVAQAPPEGRDALQAGQRQLHHQRRAGELRPQLRAPPRPQRLRDGVSGEGRAGRLQAARRARRVGRRGSHRADGARHPGNQGHRRLAHLPRRPLSRKRLRPHDLRRRLPAAARLRGVLGRASATARRQWPHLRRPPHAQRAPRPHEGVGGVLRDAVQLQGDPLLRHRGQADRAQVEGDDQPVRQDPHPDQRVRRRPIADPGVPRRIPRRGHPAHRARHARHLRHRRRDEGAGHRLPRHARTPTTTCSTSGSPATASRSPSSASARSWSMVALPADCCCRSSPRRSSGRSSSRSSSAKATRASAKATSRRYSSRWSSIRSSAAP